MMRGAKDLEGYSIRATDGDVGRVVDFLIDDKAGMRAAARPAMTLRPLAAACLASALLPLLAACDDTHAPSGAAGVDAPPSAGPVSSADARQPVGADSARVDVFHEADEAGAFEILEMHAYSHDGVTRFITWSLDTLGVPAPRVAAVDALERDLDAGMAPVRAAEKALVLALADGVAAGKIDARAMDAALAHFDAVSTARGGTAEILKRLHAALTPAERSALADKVAAHYELSRDAGDESRERTGRVARLAEQLGLDAPRVEKIRARLRAALPPGSEESRAALGREVDARMLAFQRAFTAETLDVRTIAGGDAVDARLATAGATRMVHFFEIVSPELTPAQRVDLASRMRDRATDKNPLPLMPPPGGSETGGAK